MVRCSKHHTTPTASEILDTLEPLVQLVETYYLEATQDKLDRRELLETFHTLRVEAQENDAEQEHRHADDDREEIEQADLYASGFHDGLKAGKASIKKRREARKELIKVQKRFKAETSDYGQITWGREVSRALDDYFDTIEEEGL